MSVEPPQGKKPLSTAAIIGIVVLAVVVIGVGLCFGIVLTDF